MASSRSVARPHSHTSADRRFGDGLFFAGLFAIVALVCALPVFPSGDGPVHIYFSRILYLLATHQGGVYGSVYGIRHLVQPYSLHYFWLIGAEQFVSAAIAEKSFVVAILLVNALGFRFLARQLGTAAPAVSLWILPLLLSWALGSGFLNFCFAAGLLFFAYGLYLRLAQRVTLQTTAAYGFALLLLVLSHPVPLLLLLLLLIGDTVLLLWNARRARGSFVLRVASRLLAPQAVALLLGLIAFVFPIMIADRASVADSLLRDVRPHLSQVLAIVSGDRLSLFFAATVPGVLFTALLVALAPASIALVARHGGMARTGDGTMQPADRLCLTTLVLLLATIIFPQSMNGSALFADRMVPLLWPLFIACVAAVPLSPRLRNTSLAGAVFATVLSLFFAMTYLLPAAHLQQALTEAPLPSGSRGIFVAAPGVRRPFAAHLADGLLAWGGARAFAAHTDVLLNSPWLQLTIVPVHEQGQAGLLRDHLPGLLSESPVLLGQLLQRRDAAAAQALAQANFLLYSDPAASTLAVTNAVRTYLPADAAGWRCEAHSFYALCTRTGKR